MRLQTRADLDDIYEVIRITAEGINGIKPLLMMHTLNEFPYRQNDSR